MLNKGLHSEKARSQKHLRFLHLFEGEYPDRKRREEGVVHSSQPGACSSVSSPSIPLRRGKRAEEARGMNMLHPVSCYTNPQNKIAYGVNQTKIKTELPAVHKPASKNFLHLFEGEYCRLSIANVGEEGVSIAQSVPNQTQTFLHLSEGEYPDRKRQGEGVSVTQMPTTQLILISSSFIEEDTFMNHLTFKQSKMTSIISHLGGRTDTTCGRRSKGSREFNTRLSRHGRPEGEVQTIINLNF